jgi:hypothetical protein
MAYLEQGAIVKISEISNPPVTKGEGEISMSLINYDYNTVNVQEANRLAFGQFKTTYVSGSYAAWFGHTISTDENTNYTGSLPDTYRAGYERPLGGGSGIDSAEISCSLITRNNNSQEVGLYILTGHIGDDNVVTGSVLMEVL